MSPLVILVEFLVKPEFVERFGGLIATNAKASVAREPGCQRFDVLLGPEEPRRVWLYEIYDDEAAFEAHLKSQHFKAFAAATDGQIERRSVWRLGFHAGSPKPKSRTKAATRPTARKKASKTARKVR